MRRAVSSELLKLRTTRTFFALTLSAVLLVIVISVLVSALAKFDDRGIPPAEDLVGLTFFAPLFALVLGLLAVSTEFRHGTITPTLLAVPSRGRVVAAKLIAHLIAGFLLGLIVVVLNVAIVNTILSSRGIETGTSASDAVTWIAGVSLSAALLAAIGVGIGAIVRNQVGALVGTLAWLFVVEPLLTIVPGLDDVIEKFGLGAVIDGVDGYDSGSGDQLLGMLPAGLVFCGYVAVLALVGAALLRRRDVTA